MKLAPSGVNYYEWGEKQSWLSFVPPGKLLLFCAACKVAAGISFVTGLLEQLATFCVVIYFALITYAHHAVAAPLGPPAFLTALAVVKLLTKPSATPVVKKRSD
jgi:uncharacterized membrane protein YphA (DoxX/SURF4 family)